MDFSVAGKQKAWIFAFLGKLCLFLQRAARSSRRLFLRCAREAAVALRRGKSCYMKPITFDRFARGLIIVAALVVLWFLFSYLSPVIVPFLVAAVVAYLLNPVVNFLQYTCRLRFRLPCVVLTLLLAVGVVAGLLWLCIPPMIDECLHVKDVIAHYMATGGEHSSLPEVVQHNFNEYFRRTDVYRWVQAGDIFTAVRNLVPKLWDLLLSTVSTIIGVASSLIAVLYLFFLMLDYEKYAKKWISYIPMRRRAFAVRFVDDVTYYMCGYFRGQLLIALSNCIMFSAGFYLVGFSMPLALGCFIGIISFVPYLQLAGFLPATVLALLRAAETGENFWLLIGSVVLVYIVVQIIQDVVVTPRVMGKIMGLSPAVILLSLSVGAFMFGIGGLIIALPVTTMALAYYKRYVVGEK